MDSKRGKRSESKKRIVNEFIRILEEPVEVNSMNHCHYFRFRFVFAFGTFSQFRIHCNLLFNLFYFCRLAISMMK